MQNIHWRKIKKKSRNVLIVLKLIFCEILVPVQLQHLNDRKGHVPDHFHLVFKDTVGNINKFSVKLPWHVEMTSGNSLYRMTTFK